MTQAKGTPKTAATKKSGASTTSASKKPAPKKTPPKKNASKSSTRQQATATRVPPEHETTATEQRSPRQSVTDQAKAIGYTAVGLSIMAGAKSQSLLRDFQRDVVPAPVMTAAKKVDQRVEHTLEQIEAGIERLEQRLPEMPQSVIKTVRTTGHTVRGKVRAQLFPDDSSGAQ